MMGATIHILDIGSNSIESLVIPLGSVSCIRFKYVKDSKTLVRQESMLIHIFSQTKPVIVDPADGIIMRLLDSDGSVIETNDVKEFEKSYLEFIQTQDLYQPGFPHPTV
jgi:hypothetical protein